MVISLEAHEKICLDLHKQIRQLIVENERLQIGLRAVTSDYADSHQPAAWLDREINCAYTPQELDGGSTGGLVPLYAATPKRKPLDEEQMNEAYRFIWRNMPDNFGHTASEWIEISIRYAERVHGIVDPVAKEDK